MKNTAVILGALLTVSLVSPVSATERVVLFSVRIEGDVLVVDYTKNFDTCSHLLTPDFQITHMNNFFCQSGEHVEIETPLSEFTGVEQGTQVMLCHGNNYGICSMVVSVKEGAHVSGCIRLNGLPLRNRSVLLKQKDEIDQTAITTKKGCYEFQSVVPDKHFKVTIDGPKVP